MSKPDGVRNWRSWLLPLAAIILAIGMNPSTLIPAFFITIVVAFYKKKLQPAEIAFLVTAGLAFVVWNFVSKRYGSLPYNEFRLEIFISSFRKVVDNILGSINLPILLLLIALSSIGRLWFIPSKNNDSSGVQSRITYASNAIIVFSIVWFFLFASSRWIEMNESSWRYFIYVYFALFFLGAVHLAQLLSEFGNNKSFFLSVAASLITIQFLFPPIGRINFNDYKVFQRVDALTDSGGHLYSGDYWVVWPSVLRDMMNGYESYGLTFRGGSNKKMAKENFLMRIKENGHASIYCLNDTVQNCILLINSVVGPVYAIGSSHLKDGVHLINVVNKNE